MNEIKTLGLAIKVAREGQGLSMRQLAEKAGVSVSTVSMIEGGERDPTFGTLVTIAKALGTKPSALLDVASSLTKGLPSIEKNRTEMKRKKEEVSKLTNALSATLSKFAHS